MRHTDPVQIDRSYIKAHEIIDKLLIKNKKLLEELTTLQNKPDTVYDKPPLSSLHITVGRTRINLDDPIKKWKVNHFLRYFQKQFRVMYDEDFTIAGKEWQSFGYRIYQFQHTHDEIQENSEYKAFIDWLFCKKFSTMFIASIWLISTDSMLQQWRISKKSQQIETFNDDIPDLPESIVDPNLLKDSF